MRNQNQCGCNGEVGRMKCGIFSKINLDRNLKFISIFVCQIVQHGTQHFFPSKAVNIEIFMEQQQQLNLFRDCLT